MQSMETIFRGFESWVVCREITCYHIDDGVGIIGVVLSFFISRRFMPQTVWLTLIVTARAILLPIQEPSQFPFLGKLIQNAF